MLLRDLEKYISPDTGMRVIYEEREVPWTLVQGKEVVKIASTDVDIITIIVK